MPDEDFGSVDEFEKPGRPGLEMDGYFRELAERIAKESRVVLRLADIDASYISRGVIPNRQALVDAILPAIMKARTEWMFDPA